MNKKCIKKLAIWEMFKSSKKALVFFLLKNEKRQMVAGGRLSDIVFDISI